MWGEGHLIITYPTRLSNKLCTLSNFLHTPSNILHTLSNFLRTLSNFLHTLSNFLHTLSNILRTLSNILHILSNILTLTCDAAAVDTQLARPLPPGVVNCPCVTLAFPCPVELGASQVSVHSSAPEM